MQGLMDLPTETLGVDAAVGVLWAPSAAELTPWPPVTRACTSITGRDEKLDVQDCLSLSGTR